MGPHWQASLLRPDVLHAHFCHCQAIQVDAASMHCEIWKYDRSTSQVHAKLQNLRVHCVRLVQDSPSLLLLLLTFLGPEDHSFHDKDFAYRGSREVLQGDCSARHVVQSVCREAIRLKVTSNWASMCLMQGLWTLILQCLTLLTCPYHN